LATAIKALTSILEIHNLLTMNIRTKSIFVLILFGVVDAVIPIPIIGLVLIYVIVQKPPWFLDLVREIYHLG
jgi:hypothetical protein